MFSQLFADATAAVIARVLLLVEVKACELCSNHCWLCARDVNGVKEQLKSDRLSSGFDTKQTAASQTLSSRLSDLFAQTHQKGKNPWWWGWWLRWWWRVLRQCFLSRCYSLLFFSAAISAPPFPRMTRRQSNYKRINKETAYIDPWAS